jgi:UDP-glucose 4-epimerase
MEKFGVKNIIFSSSATVYNPDLEPPFDEKMLV